VLPIGSTINSSADDAWNHHDLLGLWVEFLNSLGRLSWRHADGGGSALSLLGKNPFGLANRGDGLWITNGGSRRLPGVAVITVMREYS
jgi:hypothetical protein